MPLGSTVGVVNGVTARAPPTNALPIGVQEAANEAALTAAAVVAVAGAMIVAMAAFSIVLFVIISSRKRRRHIEVRAGELQSALAVLATVLDGAPYGRFEWAAGSGLETCSASLARLLGAPPMGNIGFADLAEYLAEGEFVRLEECSAELRAHGTEFDLVLRTVNGRLLQAAGRLAGSVGAGGAFIIWFTDVSSFALNLAAQSKKAEEAMVQQARLQEILDSAPFPAWQRRPDLSIGWVNRSYAAAVEADVATVISGSIEFVPGVRPQQSRALAQLALQTGAAQSDQRRFATGGERRTYEITESPLPKGGTAGFARDVTGREDAQNELRRHTDAHAEVMDQLPSAIVIFGPDKRLRFFNEAYCRLWGLDEDWLETHPSHGEILEILREKRHIPEQADFPAYKALVMAAYSTILEPIEEQQHLPDGRTLRVVVAPHPFGGLLLIYEDVSDRLDLERSRNTLEAVQRTTLDHLFEGVAVFGGDGRLKLFNSVYAEIWCLDVGFLATQPHVSEVAERCRNLFPLGRGGWPKVKERIVQRALDRRVRMECLERPDGVTIEYASVPLPDGNTLYTYFDVSDGVRLGRVGDRAVKPKE